MTSFGRTVAVRRGLLSCLLVGWALLLPGCANYDERLAEVHTIYYGGNPQRAVDALSALYEKAVRDGSADAPAIRLELAMALQTAGDTRRAASLLRESADELEVLDYTSAPLETMADLVFAPGSHTYRVSPPEWVAIHTQNILNHTLSGDGASATIEARRAIDALEDHSTEAYGNSFVWALAGLVLAANGDAAGGHDAFRLAGETALDEVHVPVAEPVPEESRGTLLVVVQMGKVPMRREATYVLPWGGKIYRVNVPMLVERPTAFREARLMGYGAPIAIPAVYDLGRHVMQRFEEERPRLLAASLTQALGRAEAANIVGDAAKSNAGKSGEMRQVVDAGATSLFGWFMGEAQGVDTRSWTLLPERFHAFRLDLPAGTHTVAVELLGTGSRTESRTVDVPAGGLAVLNITAATRTGHQPLPENPERPLPAEWLAEIEAAMVIP